MESAPKVKTEINLRFGSAVKRLRNQLGISQETLAELAELDRTYIGHVERGARNVSLLTIDKLARALRVTTGALLTVPSESEIRPVDGATSTSPIQKISILLVEGHQKDVESTLRTFQKADVLNSIQILNDGAQALDYLLGTGPASEVETTLLPGLILLDLKLPKVGGLELLRRIKSEPRTRNVPVVVLVASAQDEGIDRALRLGAITHLIKPLDFRSFSEIVPKLNLGWMLVNSAD